MTIMAEARRFVIALWQQKSKNIKLKQNILDDKKENNNKKFVTPLQVAAKLNKLLYIKNY